MKRSRAMRVATVIVLVVLIVAFALARLLPRGSTRPPVSPASPTASVPATTPAEASEPALTSTESLLASAEAALPDKPTPGKMTVVFALEQGSLEPTKTLIAVITKGDPKVSASHLLYASVAARTVRAISGPGPFEFKLRFDPSVVKAGRGYWLRVYVIQPGRGAVLYSSVLPLDEEVPSGIEVMGQSK